MVTFRTIDNAHQCAKMSILHATLMRKKSQPLRIVARTAIVIGKLIKIYYISVSEVPNR